MIQANELRMGNWVKYINGKDTFKVRCIHEFGLDVENEIESTYIEFESFEPIPLTPEILEKCGFKWSIYHQAWHKQGFVFDLSERSVGGFWMHKSRLNSEIICPEIKYLHQLQNLYFALTGEELNYTP